MTPTINAAYGATPPNDRELSEFVEYVGGLMTDAAAEAFEDRLVEDEGFYHRMGPLLKAWASSEPVRFEAEIGTMFVRERAIAPSRRWTMSVGRLAAAAAVVLGVIGTGVVTFESRQRADIGRAVAQVPAIHHNVRAGGQVSTAQPQTQKTVAAVGDGHRSSATRPKVIAVREPKTSDTATKPPVVVAVSPRADTGVTTAVTAVTAVVKVEVATVDSTLAKVDSATAKDTAPAKVDSATPKVDSGAAKVDPRLAKVDTTSGPGEGNTIIMGNGRPKNRRWWWPGDWHRK
jgi:hypothetical protein